MNDVFQTFKPKYSLLEQYVDYYYIDSKPNNVVTEFKCFPHFNNTISLYKSHERPSKGEIFFNPKAKPLQIFTPIRENVLDIKQTGKVERIVIVFKPLGIQQFYRDIYFSDWITDFDFFTEEELNMLFEIENVNHLNDLLDELLLERYSEYRNENLSSALNIILNDSENISVEEVANHLKISRRHLNRIFQVHFGTSVKKFFEIVRFRKTVNQKLFVTPDDNFTQLAYDFYFADQSHLNKIYKNFTSNSPNSFFNNGTILGKEDTFWHITK